MKIPSLKYIIYIIAWLSIVAVLTGVWMVLP